MTDFVVPIRPRYGEVDRMGFVYHAHYLVYFEIGRTEYMRARGVAYAGVEDRGHRLVVADAQLRYVRPACYDEELSLTVRLGRQRGASVVFEYELSGPEGGLRASGSTRLGCVDVDGRPSRLPNDLTAALSGRPDAAGSSEGP
jgi:acyl-CoA thioester hydrolase